MSEHRSAPVELHALWFSGVEADPERELIGQGQRGDLTRRHRIRQAGGAARGIQRHSPQRTGDARKQQKERGRDRQRLQQHEHHCAQTSREPRLVRAELHRQHGEQQRGHPGERQHRHRDRLRVEEPGQQQKEAEKDHHEQIPARAQLQQLQSHRQHQRGDSRFAAEHRAVLREHPCAAAHGCDPSHQIRGQRTAAERQRDPPEEQSDEGRRCPQRHVGQVRRRCQQGGHEQEKRVAPFAIPDEILQARAPGRA